jgi:phosphatidylserine/phosphatidylglycerophosphate/cardiolipin synthase-like enzyme
MKPDEIDAILRATLADAKLSRGERQAVSAILADLGADRGIVADVRARAFRAARGAIEDRHAGAVLDWLEEVVRLLESRGRPEAPPARAEAWFSPGDVCVRRIAALIDGAKKSIDVCVYTITDDRLSQPIVAAHAHGVRVRILTDNEKAADIGSDIPSFEQAGIAVRVDDSEDHMHHKFAVVDGRTLITGSYNWTRSASDRNRENIVITEDPRLLEAFRGEFESLWSRFC